MEVRKSRFLLLAFALLAVLVGCSRKSGEGTTASGDTAAPAPEVVMPDTPATPAVDTAPTLTPSTDSTVVGAPPNGATPPMSGTESAASSAPLAPMQPPGDPLLAIAQTKAAGIDAGLSGYTLRSQPQVFGTVRSDVAIYTNGNQVVLIEEKLTTTDNSISTNKYYFDNGSLFLYQDDGRWLDVNPPNPLVTRNFRRNMAFTASGKLITASKTVDGNATNVGEYEAVAVLARAQQLLGPLAEANTTGPGAPPDSAAAPVAVKADGSSTDTATASPAEAPAAKAKPAKTAASETKPGSEVAAAETANRIQLSDSRSATQVRGSAPARGSRDYVVHAKAGQLLTLALQGSSTTVFAVYSSRGEIVADLTNWSSKLPRDGDYTIKVGQKGGTEAADFLLDIRLQ